VVRKANATEEETARDTLLRSLNNYMSIHVTDSVTVLSFSVGVLQKCGQMLSMSNHIKHKIILLI
jgi:ATP-dependent Clp protease adapter protein ClpS